MTWVYDDSGKRWVEPEPRKRRRSPRALRFAEIKVGDQLMQAYVTKGWGPGQYKAGVPPRELSRSVTYWLVTDLWFDPVAGQTNHVAGEMVAVIRIEPNGKPSARKYPHTKRGLASQGFHYADRDYVAFCGQRLDAMKENVVGIGRGVVIRRRPKQPGSRF